MMRWRCMTRCLWWRIPLVMLLLCLGSCQSISKYAYATVHYEGTSRDAEYVLGIQAWVQSIKLTNSPYDVVVLVSESVSEATKIFFRQIGCRVLPVNNIQNPFIDTTLKNPGFMYTLNKLHVWNLIEYSRVIYMDADNLVLRNMHELFSCGKFCVVFQNPCHFHTGLMVITPDLKDYNYLLSELNYRESFDGADQGFLSSVYSTELRKAKLFLPSSRDAESPDPAGQRLSTGYNLNHKYFYEQFHWKLFMLRDFANMTTDVRTFPVVVPSAQEVPALTLGFPISTSLKPWYWWSCAILDIHWIWHDVRATIPSSEEAFGANTLVVSALYVVISTLSFGLLVKYGLVPQARLSQRHVFLHVVGSGHWLGYIVRLTMVIVSMICAGKSIHPLCRAPLAFAGYIVFQHWFLLIAAMVLCAGCSYARSSWTTYPLSVVVYEARMSLGLSVMSQVMILYLCAWHGFMNIIWKMIIVGGAVVVLIGGQTLVVRSMVVRAMQLTSSSSSSKST